MTRHFLTGEELNRDELLGLIERALELKAAPLSSDVLLRRSVALIFQRPSTRTRLSFEAGVAELGGHPLVLRTDDLQLTRGESVRDTALVLSRQVAAVGLRTGPHALVEELASWSAVPVINMLTAEHHPCQALADLLTLREAFGRLEGLKVAYVGDGNNVARSLVILGRLAGVEVVVAAPDGYALDGGTVTDPREAVAGAQAVYTDVWVSMGDEETADARRSALAPYRRRRRAARGRGARRDRAALPARAPRRGDHRGGPLRPAPAHLGPGREPPSRPEGVAGAAGRLALSAARSGMLLGGVNCSDKEVGSGGGGARLGSWVGSGGVNCGDEGGWFGRGCSTFGGTMRPKVEHPSMRHRPVPFVAAVFALDEPRPPEPSEQRPTPRRRDRSPSARARGCAAPSACARAPRGARS